VARFHLRTLGGLSLHEGSPHEPAVLGASKSLAVLVYLARAPGRAALRSHLSELLWPGLPRKKARRALRQCLYYLTQRAGTELWAADDGRLSLADGKLEVDVWTLDRALEEERWADAVEAYGGPFMAGFDGKAGLEFEHWAEAQHERVWAGVKAACHRLVEESLQGEPADPAKAVRYAARCVDLNPLDERAQEALVRAHLAAGDRVEAFRAYEAYRTLLREELGEVPGPELAFRTEEIRAALFGRHPAGARAAAERRTPEVVRLPRKTAGEDGPVWPGQPHHDLRTAAGTGAEGRSPPEPGATAGGGEPPAPPEAPGAAEPFPLGWRGLAWGLLGAAAAVVVMTLGARSSRTKARAREADPPDPVVRLLAARVGDDPHGEREDSAYRVSVPRSGAPSLEMIARPPRTDLASPDGRRIALHLRGPHGADIGVRDGEGPVRTLVAGIPDEWSTAWSPDGRYLLYCYGARLRGDSLFVERLAVADAETGMLQHFPVLAPAMTARDGTWSPAGTAIAFIGVVGADSGLYVADVDGRRQVRIPGTPGPDRNPAWSPDGRLLAFASRHDGSWDLYLVRPDGTGLRQLTFSMGDETSPTWLSGHELAYVEDRGGVSDLWAVDLTTRSARRLSQAGDVAAARLAPRGLTRSRVERVRIEPRDRAVSPGQAIDLRARVTDAAGKKVPPVAARLRWSSSDTSVLRVGPDGRGRVVGEGEAKLVASAGGWRADTLRVTSAALAETSAPLALSEDWTTGLDTARWTPFGDPAPEVVAGTGPSGHAFLNDGDANYDSGVLSRRAVPLSRGVTVEWWASLPMTGQHYQALVVGLSSEPGVDPNDRNGPVMDVLRFGAEGNPSGTWIQRQTDGTPRAKVPLPDHPDAWHRYALELRPDGTVLYLIDGRLRWRSRPGFVDSIPSEARLRLSGRSLHTRILTGPVRVWQGVRWALPDAGTEGRAPGR